MSFDVRLSPRAEKELNKLLEKDQVRVLRSLMFLVNDPLSGKKLKGEFKGFYSLRVWPFRIIYTIMKKESCVIVIRIGHRKDSYR